MSSNNRFLALRLEGPLQSWGFDSQYSRRNTGLLPTKSAIAGMCCAALGYSRGCNEEGFFLAQFSKLHMTAIAIPHEGIRKALPVRRLQDYHTVQNTRTAKGDLKDCHITHRQYLTDAAFGVILEGDNDFLSKIVQALADPKWGIWLGRKTCIPTAPVLADVKMNSGELFCLLKETRDEALKLLIGDKELKSFTYQADVDDFTDGRDAIPDTPISFAIEKRLFSPRRIFTHNGRN